MGASVDALAAADGVGTIIAESVHTWFVRPGQPASWSSGSGPPASTSRGPRAASQPKVLAGMTVVVTGTLEGFAGRRPRRPSRPGAASRPGSVSKKTTAVVVGEAPGAAKVTKAEELGVPVLDEAAFAHLLDTGELPR